MKNHDESTSECCHADEAPKKPWYSKFLFWILALNVFLLSLTYFVPHFATFRFSFFDYLKIMAVPIFLGVMIGGIVDHFVPKQYVIKYLSGHKKRTVFYASALGFLMSACSHGILALSMELHKKGASGPAVISFLLASPWANLPITFLLVGFFGLRGFLIIAAALFVSFSTGLALQVSDRKGWIEKNKNRISMEADFSIRKDLARRIKNYRFSVPRLFQDIRGITKGMAALADMMMAWVLLGILLASAASAFVPGEIFHKFLGPSFLGLLTTLGLATILEVCSEGTSPLAFEIYRQTGALGNAFAFLMGGVVTDVTEVGLVWQNLGKKTAFWMLVISIPQVFILGCIFNSLF